MTPTRPFFVTEGTLAYGAESYVVRQADRDLLECLERGEFAYVLDSRQKGKSSLMIRAREALSAMGRATVLLDLQRFGSNLAPEQWYASLLHVVGEQLGMEDRLFQLWDEQAHAGPMRKFFGAVEKAVEEIGRACTIFVDEVDYVRSLPFSTDEFFAAIRECHNRRASGGSSGLSFCLLGVATPSELIRDVRITPFNIGKRIELTDFTLADLGSFELPLSEGKRDGRTLLKRIHHWTGGHPYLTQKLAARVASDPSVKSAGGVDRLVEELFFSLKARTQDPNLADVSRRVLESPVEGVGPEEARARVLDLYQQVRDGRVRDDETDPVVTVLKLSGLTTVLEGYLAVRNRIYFRSFDRSWVEANLPEAEALRVRRAAREAAWRVGMIAALIGAVIAILAVFGLTQTVRANAALLVAKQQTVKAKEALVKAKQGEDDANRFAREAARSDGNAERAKDQALRAANEAIKDRNAALAAKTLADQQRRTAVAATARAAAQQQLALAAKSTGDRLLYQANMNLIQNAWKYHQRDRIEELLRDTAKPEFNAYRGPEWGFWDNRIHTELATLTPPGDTGLSATFSNDSKLVVTVDKKAGVRLWNAEDASLVRVLRQRNDALKDAVFSPNGRLLLLRGTGDPLLIDLKGRYEQTLRGQQRAVFFPKSSLVLSFDRNGPSGSIWDGATGRRLLRLKGDFSARQLAEVSPDGQRILTGDDPDDPRSWNPQPASPRLWDTTTGDLIQTLKQRKGVVTLFSFSPDAQHIATAGDDPLIQIWAAKSGNEETSLQSPHTTNSIAFSPDSQKLVAVKYGGTMVRTQSGWQGTRFSNHAYLWSLGSSQPTKAYGDLESGYQKSLVVFDPFSDRFAIKETGRLSLCSVLSDKVIHPELEDSQNSIAWDDSDRPSFSPDGARMISAANDGTVRVWDSRTGACLLTIPGGPVGRASPDGSRILEYSRASQASIRLFDARVSREFLALDGGWFGGFIDDGKRAVIVEPSGHRVRIVDPLSGAEIARTERSWLKDMDLSPDGKFFASLQDSSVALWSTLTGKDVRAPINLGTGANLFDQVKFVDGGKSILVTSKGKMHRFDLGTGKELVTTQKLMPPMSWPGSEMSPRGLLKPDGFSVVVLDAKSGREKYRLKGFRSDHTAAFYSSDLSRIVTSSYDRRVILWDSRDGRQLLEIDSPSSYSSFSPRDSYLLCVSVDQTQIWPTSRASARKMHFFREPDWVCDQLLSSASNNDKNSWRWQVKNWLTPSLLKSREVQERLLYVANARDDWFGEQALAMVRHLPADFYRKWAEYDAQKGEWDKAYSAIKNQVSGGNGSATDWKTLALINLARGQQNEAREAAQKAMKLALAPGCSASDVIQAGIACRALPGILDDYRPLAAAIQRAVLARPSEFALAAAPGAISYRMGDYKNAERSLAIVAKGQGGSEFAKVFLAMTLAKLGRREEARSLLDEVHQWAGTGLSTTDWDFKLEFGLLLHEADDMIGWTTGEHQ